MQNGGTGFPLDYARTRGFLNSQVLGAMDATPFLAGRQKPQAGGLFHPLTRILKPALTFLKPARQMLGAPNKKRRAVTPGVLVFKSVRGSLLASEFQGDFFF